MKNILIVDDNKDILKALHLGLCSCLRDCEIQTALNGEAGMAILKTKQVDLIITDLDMPVLNGYRFIEKARHDFPLVPVCVMAGSCLDDARTRLNAMGVSHVIQKPFLFENLAELITNELNLGQPDALTEETGHA